MEHWVFWGCFGFSRGILGIFVRVPGCSGFSRRCSGVFQVFHTVPGVPGCSEVFRCSVFRCSGVPEITTCHRTPSLVVLPNGVALVTFYAWIGWSTGFFFDCLFYDFQVCFVVYIFHPKVSHPSTQRWKTPRILRIVSTQKV